MKRGTVKKLYYQAGEIAKVHSPLFAMDIDPGSDLLEAREDNIQPTESVQASQSENSETEQMRRRHAAKEFKRFLSDLQKFKESDPGNLQQYIKVRLE